MPLCMLTTLLNPSSSIIRASLLHKRVFTIFLIWIPSLKNSNTLSINLCSILSNALEKSTHKMPIFSLLNHDCEMLSRIFTIQLPIFLCFKNPFCPLPIFLYKYFLPLHHSLFYTQSPVTNSFGHPFLWYYFN